MKYRKKPVVIEAVRFDGNNRREVLSFIYPDMSEDGLRGAEAMALPVVIGTLEGDMTVNPGDFVIRGVAGEFYPCKPNIFAATYEPVEWRGVARMRMHPYAGWSTRARAQQPAAPDSVDRLIYLDTIGWTCDWGDCEAESAAIRWSEHGWLPVCVNHTTTPAPGEVPA